MSEARPTQDQDLQPQQGVQQDRRRHQTEEDLHLGLPLPNP